MYYYQFHIGDYKTHTHHLNAIEDIAYRRLLDHYYLHEAPIKQRDIARQIGLREYEQEVLSILDEFFVSTEHGFINPRADAEIKAFREHQATSAFGALVRDNPSLKPLIDKEVFIRHYMDKTHQAYVASLTAHDVPITPTSPTLDATGIHEPLPINRNPVKNTKKAVVPPDGVTDIVWQDFIDLRKAKKAPISQSALDGIAKEAGKAGITLQAALEMCCMRGWTGFKAEWLKDKDAGQKSFAEKEYDFKRKRWEAMTGRTSEYSPFLEIEDDTTH